MVSYIYIILISGVVGLLLGAVLYHFVCKYKVFKRFGVTLPSLSPLWSSNNQLLAIKGKENNKNNKSIESVESLEQRAAAEALEAYNIWLYGEPSRFE